MDAEHYKDIKPVNLASEKELSVEVDKFCNDTTDTSKLSKTSLRGVFIFPFRY